MPHTNKDLRKFRQILRIGSILEILSASVTFNQREKMRTETHWMWLYFSPTKRSEAHINDSWYQMENTESNDD